MEGKQILAANDSNWTTEVDNSQTPVFVEFWAPWCGPCQTMMPIVESLSEEHQKGVKFVKVNVDESPGVTQRLSVFSIPTVMIFKEGKQVFRFVGVATKSQLSNKLKMFVG